MFDWIVSIVSQVGLPGVVFLTLLETVVPPIPSELIVPLAGFEAARGRFSFAGVILAGTLGATAGAVFWYELGRRIGSARLGRWADHCGRWLGLSGGDVVRLTAWFERRGAWAVFLGRLAPGVRTLISIPAGVAGMPRGAFLAWTTAGTAVWTALLAAAGRLLHSQYDRVQAWTNPAANLVFAAGAALYVYRVATWPRRKADPPHPRNPRRRRGVRGHGPATTSGGIHDAVVDRGAGGRLRTGPPHRGQDARRARGSGADLRA